MQHFLPPLAAEEFFCRTKISKAAPTEQRPDFRPPEAAPGAKFPASGGGPRQISQHLEILHFQDFQTTLGNLENPPLVLAMYNHEVSDKFCCAARVVIRLPLLRVPRPSTTTLKHVPGRLASQHMASTSFRCFFASCDDKLMHKFPTNTQRVTVQVGMTG